MHPMFWHFQSCFVYSLIVTILGLFSNRKCIYCCPYMWKTGNVVIKMLSVRNWQLQWDNHNKAAAFEPVFFASRFYKSPISALSVCCWFFNEFSGNMSLNNSRFFKVEMQSFCIIHLLLILLMNLTEKLLCRIFTFRFCKSQSWNAEFLRYIFVVDFSMNVAEI